MPLTASHLYDYLQCPHKVWRDLHGPQDEKSDEKNDFVELLWKKGVQHEENIIAKLGEFENLADGSLEERFAKTLRAMEEGVDLIYQGVIEADGLRGIPDLLHKLPDGMYLPVDIKSGMAFSGADSKKGKEGKYKKDYAAQLCLYTDILRKLGFATHKLGKIIDGHRKETIYELELPQGPQIPETYWGLYERLKAEIIPLMEDRDRNKPAMSGICKLCPWYVSCKKWCEDNDDLTNIFDLGRAKRNTLNDDLTIDKVHELPDVDIEEIMSKKKKDRHFLPGIAEKSLTKIVRRANILVNVKTPVLHEPIDFPDVSYELFFDIENDPTQEFVYLHGVYERGPKGERFLDFTTKEMSPEEEEGAWKRFWNYIDSLPKDDYAVYYYSAHEKTTYKKMQKQYSDVISAEKVEEFFDNPNAIDLYQIILKKTDWPLGSYGLKAIAQYLGFKWQDKNPSGAASIEWFNQYIETKDPEILERILIYNKDDCRATMVVKDALGRL